MTGSTTAHDDSTRTVLDHLVDHIRSKDVALDGQVRPVAILWTDPKREWLPIIEMMQTHLGELIVLGDYDPGSRRGPAIWIRCLLDGALDEPQLPPERAPIVYLPGIARQDLRAGEECRPELRPVVELMYRGTLWLQNNGSDWTVAAFLTSPRVLGLEVSRNTATTEALLRALPEVVVTPVSQLLNKSLEADDFDRMLSDDVIRDLLRWMGDTAGTRARLGENGWEAFRSRCGEELDFDPEVEEDVTAGERLGLGQGAWARVWDRFVESPKSYGDIVGVLRRSRPSGSLAFDRSRWPDLNDEDEDGVRSAFEEIDSLGRSDACDCVVALEDDHGKRRDWVWSRMGLSPMAEVLAPLSRLAAATTTAIGGTTPDEIASTYLERGWQADAATWEAIAAVPTADEPLVHDVVRHLLEPWLNESARAFQEAVQRNPLPNRGNQIIVEATDDACLLFADGLRYDLGRRLAERLEGHGYRVTVDHRWSALPTVTATAKPAVTPTADAIIGDVLGEDFAPKFEDTDKAVDAKGLRYAMKDRGYQILGPTLGDWPEAQPARGWVEAGEIDSLGHKLKTRLARQINEELDRLADRIDSLLQAGWQAVRVITDHGWLLLPGGLPKVDLPKHLTKTRWSRCAVILGESNPDVMRVPWHWNTTQSFATAPGCACFNRSEVYAHGGLSIQECLIPDILVERTEEQTFSATIKSVTWRGMRCFIEVATQGMGLSVDLRLDRPSGESVAASPKALDEDGATSVVLESEEHEEAQLVLVVLDSAGSVLAHKPTNVGVNS